MTGPPQRKLAPYQSSFSVEDIYIFSVHVSCFVCTVCVSEKEWDLPLIETISFSRGLLSASTGYIS